MAAENCLQILVVPLIVLGLLLGASRGRSQELTSREAEIKAGLVAIQGKLWTWPPAVAPAGGAPLKIGVLGPDPFQQGDVNQLDKKLAGQNIAVERYATADKIQPCHILFVSQAAELPPALEKVPTRNVLIIAQAPGLAKRGAVINLVVEGNRVRMEVNPDEAKRRGLTVDPRIYNLSMVKVVR
jgi:hypothetical protein